MLTLEAQPGIVVMVVDVKIRRDVRERVEKLDAEGRCVRCCKKVVGKEVRRLGLCNNCHYRYRNDRKNKPESEINLLDAAERKKGILMENRQGQRLNRNAG